MESLTGQILVLYLLSGLLALGIGGLGGLTLLGFFGRYWYWFDICNHFRFQYFVLLIILTVPSFWMQEWILVWLALASALINVIVILPIFIRPVGWKGGQPQYRLLLANVLRRNHSYHLMLELIRVSQPNIIALVEPDQPWIDAMASIKEQYPFQHVAPQDDNYGLALFSQHPLENQVVHILTGKGAPTLSAEVCLDSQTVCVLVTHPPPPKNSADMIWRERQIERLSGLVNDQEIPVIVCGDFNITPWSLSYRMMEREGKLVDSSRGFGFQPTWPVNRPWLRVPIDHCLVSAGIQVVQRKVGPQIGSDHLPLVVDFRLSQPGD
jgi:endonuclease/exonuclease/phosphatase (EEP) superfamily protein YafD